MKTKEDEVIALRKQGLTYQQIQDKLNLSSVTVCRYIAKNNMLKRDMYPLDVINKIKKLADNGAGVREIAEKVGIEYNLLRGLMFRKKIRINKKNILKDKILSLADSLTPKEIAAKLGVSVDYVRVVRYRGGANCSAKKLRAIRAYNMLNAGMDIDDIAKKLKVKPITVARYIKGGFYE